MADQNQAVCVIVVIFVLQIINIQQQQMAVLLFVYQAVKANQQMLQNMLIRRQLNRRLRRQRLAPLTHGPFHVL